MQLLNGSNGRLIILRGKINSGEKGRGLLAFCRMRIGVNVVLQRLYSVIERALGDFILHLGVVIEGILLDFRIEIVFGSLFEAL